MIWTEGFDNLKIFIDHLNNIHSTIKFTSSHSSTNIPFLDVSVSLTNDGSISTDLYTKPTDKHQHLLYSSCHPLNTKKAIPFSLALRLRRIRSTDSTFIVLALLNLPLTSLNEVTNVTSSTNKCDAPPTSPANSLYKPKTSTNLNEYHLELPLIHHFLTSLTSSKKHFNLLLSSNRCKNGVFQHLPVVAFRRSLNRRDLLVTAKLPSNSANAQLPFGSFRCGKNCAT